MIIIYASIVMAACIVFCVVVSTICICSFALCKRKKKEEPDYMLPTIKRFASTIDTEVNVAYALNKVHK